MEIDCSGFLVRKKNEYLVAIPYTDTLVPRWSVSRYDGCVISGEKNARRVAKRVGGDIVRFDPVSGRIMEV